MKVVIKVGTQSILASDGTPFEPTMLQLVEQIVRLQKTGHHVVLVSSGAVASGRKTAYQLLGRQYGSSLGEKQVLAAVGQHELMHLYASMFKVHNILAAQLLLTKQDFQTRRHYLNISRLLQEILDHKNIVPIINENDSVAIEELMFTDNDELAGLIAAQMNADKLIIISNVEGVYTGHPHDPTSKLISLINPNEGWPEVAAFKSLHGRGGMVSKLGTARKMSTLGITTHIASMAQPDAITRIMNQETIGTTILPSKKKSNIKRWIAYNTDKNTGSIFINPCLLNIIKENKRVISILPVGIEKFLGQFKRGDLVDILTLEGQRIGVGVAKYDAVKLSEWVGQQEKPVFIHYDHLHIF
ncbi:MAG: glutamate 5-kinase [Gammaproteobacteria bacterium]|nr:glutamate 5-kinase [Gammaproteobacteria bacterium]